LRILPYRTAEGKHEGAVVTLMEIFPVGRKAGAAAAKDEKRWDEPFLRRRGVSRVGDLSLLEGGDFTIESLQVGADSAEFAWLFSKLPNLQLDMLHTLFGGVQTLFVRLFAWVNPLSGADEPHTGVQEAEHKTSGRIAREGTNNVESVLDGRRFGNFCGVEVGCHVGLLSTTVIRLQGAEASIEGHGVRWQTWEGCAR
jgi:hypothetical protein